MRDPQRIDVILNLIKGIWHRCPDLRLMQLLFNALPVLDAGALYNIEDEDLVEKLKEYSKYQSRIST